MTTTDAPLLTAEDLLARGPAGDRHELVNGRIVPMMAPSPLHGRVAGKIFAKLDTWSEASAGGYPAVEAAFTIRRNPDTVRLPDVSWVSASRIPADFEPQRPWSLAPDLAVEIVSPSDSAEGVLHKVRDYLDAGTPLVWIVYPEAREIVAHTPDGLAQRFTSADRLEGFATLPGFSVAVAELFPAAT